MSIASRILGKLCRLPPATTHDIVVKRDVEIPMPDGVILLADHYVPRGGDTLPLILCRSPYGRRGLFGLLFAWPFAERGYQVLIQSCRGTFGSGGDFACLSQEREDGRATVEWIKTQPWFPGEMGTVGASYLGYTQWAIASEAGPELKAMAPLITTSTFTKQFYMGESFSLEGHLGWSHMMRDVQHSRMALFGNQSKLQRVMMHLPLSEADQVLIGKQTANWQDVIQNSEPEYDWWKSTDRRDKVTGVQAQVNFQSGWFDIFLPWMMEDYQLLRQAGHNPYMTIGPWQHGNPAGMAEGLRQSLAWHNAHLRGDRSGLREAPVRLFVMGADEWRDFPEWPPPGFQPKRYYLQPGGGLATETLPLSDPDRYRYDPADPTPNLAGAMMTGPWGQRDNRELEARSDVLVYTSKPIEQGLEAIGPVSAEFFVRSSLEHTDFFARLCDVEPSGKSMNVCDGLLHLVPGRPAREPDGCLKVAIDLWPTAYRFRRGHALRLQVSSGAFPRWARNLGSGEPLATATTLCTADQEVYHDPAHPSAVVLPVLK
jgi:putative CocE/NonD family hydrolase